MNTIVNEIFGEEKPERHERFQGEYPVRVRGLVNSFGDQVIHEDLDLQIGFVLSKKRLLL